MSKKLAIKGHPTRGKEVIELLEMFGGVAAASKGFRESYCYYVSENFNPKYISWDYIGPDEIDKYKIFTLEEFLEKYPFKVGDKVYIKVDPNANCLGSEKIYGEIESAVWVEESGYVVYKLKDCSGIFYRDELYPCEEEVSMEDNKLTSKYYEETQSKRDMYKTMFMLVPTLVPNKMDDKLGYEIIDGYEFDKVENNKIILKPIKPKYPKTYEECLSVLGYDDRETYCICHTGANERLFESLYRLKVCRDAYWKIAGEQMGLDKPWEPDFTDTKEMYYIFYKGYIEKGNQRHPDNHILIFPTAEMRDAFFENFKDSIKECKELL
jgi:hypothetical protein